MAQQRGVAPAAIERLRNDRNARYSELLAQAPRVTAGVTDVLDALHGRYVMGVVTSSRKDHFDVIHRNTGLLKYFDFVLTASDFTRVKPHPEPYVRAVRGAACRRRRVWPSKTRHAAWNRPERPASVVSSSRRS